MKKINILLILLVGLVFAGCNQTKKAAANDDEEKVVASTSWTAAFADIAGANQVKIIAPANLQHPPEYEITVNDIQTIEKSKYFIYAGFERMMKTLGDAVGETQMVKITCDNSIETVSKESRKIAEIWGSQKECEKRLSEYVSAINNAKADLEKRGLAGARVLCNKNQTYLAKDLGLEVAAVFGPGPVTSDQIADAKTGNYAFIIDNVHNPQGRPLAEVAPNAKYLVWRNFPEKVERGALLNVIKENIKTLE
ncbi:MAG: ABC transporter substrate-binding protein [Treponema sp.]|nr:ABC transporter substrate-binding protein [Treponema sp.]